MIPRTKRGGWAYSQVPNVDFEINWDEPVTKGLVFALPMFGPRVVGTQRFVDLAQRRIVTPFNAPAWTPDSTYGNALLFDDGASEYLRTTNSVPVTAAPFSMTCWFYTDDLTSDQGLITIADAAVWNNYWIFKIRGATDQLQLEARDVGGAQAGGPLPALSLNTWYHGAAVIRSSTERDTYLNGGDKATAGNDITPAGIDHIGIAARVTNGAGDYLSGGLAEVLIWDRGLSDSEVAWLANPNNRWKLYRPRIPPLYAFVAAAPTGRQPRYGYTNFQIPGIV